MTIHPHLLHAALFKTKIFLTIIRIRDIYLFFSPAGVTTVTVGDVQAAEDNVFTTTVATSESLPEHMLVDLYTHTHVHQP